MGTSYHCSGVDKAAVVCQLHAIIDHYLLGEGNWPVHTEAFPALHKKLRELGLSEDIPDQPDFERSTALGTDLRLDLLMAFIGVQADYEIVIILEQNGYIEQSEADIFFDLLPLQAERKLHRYVLRAYRNYCNRSLPSH